MNCSQVLPGAVNPNPCSLATGYCSGEPFVVYASGRDVILLDGHLQHVQTIFGSSCGYGEAKVSCVHCAEKTGRLAVGWGSEVVIFRPFLVEETGELYGREDDSEQKFLFEWNVTHTLNLGHEVLSMSWNADGTRLLTGGECLTLWETTGPSLQLPEEEETEGSEETVGEQQQQERKEEKLEVTWKCPMPNPVTHLKFAPSGVFFASCGENDCLVKIWYPTIVEATGIGSPCDYSYCYIAHPHTVRGFNWRRMTTSFPKGCIPNVLLTHCTDNICRIWSHSLSYVKKGHLRFFIAASIDPVADIPFRTTMPLDDQPFLVHWLNNKETTLTSKVEKFQKGISTPMSHVSSIQSFTSNINEEIFQSWVCIEEEEEFGSPTKQSSGSSGGIVGSKMEVELTHPTNFPRKSSSYGANLHVGTVSGSGDRRNSSTIKSSTISSGQSRVSLQYKRALAHLLDEWCATPDLLLCIHPTVGSLMVWTVEGIDAPINQERLVHVSFSSCLPHVFPPHLAQSLQPDLLQFLIKEPDVLHAREATSGGEGNVLLSTAGGGRDISLPVPQIRLSSGGSMSAMSHMEMAEDMRKVKPDSTLILVSSHSNGSLNTWSVELTIQSNSCTSIAGLIHCAGTGGHRSQVTQIHRHPWLPILMTISSPKMSASDDSSSSSEEKVGENFAGTVESADKVSELIIWNADLPGPLQNKSRVNELSRLTSHTPGSFNYVAWVPPISTESVQEGALARCPSQGLFVANVGQDLVLFQASLYSITKPQPSSFMQTDKEKGKKEQKQRDATKEAPSSPRPASPSHILHRIEVTSQLGVKGVEVVSIIKNDLHELQEIIGLHVFRMCSLVTTTDLKVCKNSKFYKDVLLVLLENRKPEESTQVSHTSPSSRVLGPKGTKTYLHLWRLSLYSQVVRPPSPTFPSSQPETIKESGNVNPNEVNYSCSIKKIFSKPQPLPLPSGTFVVESSPACDISSSLQLQTPTLSAPYLFSTACSDGTVRCWQFSVDEDTPSSSPERCHTPVPEDEMDSKDVLLSLYEVFSSGSSTPESTSLKPRIIDCLEEDIIRSLPTESYVPVGIKVAYPGRIAMAHLLSKPVSSSTLHTPLASPTLRDVNPNHRHSMVTIWECESSGGLQWSCEATLMLIGVAQVAAGKNKSHDMKVLMEWVPMENGAYLLVTSFASTISVFGMAIPQETEQFAVVKKESGLRVPEGRTVPTLTRVKAQASWVCLLEFPCFRLSVDVPINCLTYTGGNSLVVSIGGELQLYSCWVQRDKLASVSKGYNTKDKLSISKTPAGRVQASSSAAGTGGRLGSSSNVSGNAVNLLDYAHACNTPLPQYHPKILLELMNSGKLAAMKSILINLIRFLLLYRANKKKKTSEDEDEAWNSFDEGEAMEEEKTRKKKRQKQLSLSSDGHLERSRQSQPRKYVDYIPPLPLSKMGIVDATEASTPSESLQVDGGGSHGAGKKSETDDYDELFSMTNIEMELDDDEEGKEVTVTFADLSPEKTEFTSQLSNLLSTLLDSFHLPELNDLDHIQLVSIAQTLTSTQSKFGVDSASGVGEDTTLSSANALSFSALSGAGYASSGVSSQGREAMDNCGLRYLLALESSEALTSCLPEGVLPAPLPPSSLVWAFHSDAETELLSAIPCIRDDNLEWEGLRKAGVGWWLRSLDTLRRLIEKLAKAVFIKKQQPLDASLFYLAMKKQSLLKTLFKSVADTRMSTFFSNDFTTDRWKKAAQKNAFALLGKQRFEEAAAFFLLAGKLWDAVEVCVSRLHDLQLAFVLVRLYEGDHGEMYQRFLKEQILGVPSQSENSSLGPKAGVGDREKSSARSKPRLEANPNPFLRSMVHWLLQDYSGALETLLINPEQLGEDGKGKNSESSHHAFLSHPAIFNFYFFLRNHPVLMRRDYKTSFLTNSHLKDSVGGSAKFANLSSVGEEPLTPVERNLLFSTAYYHLSHGCPLLALNVLQHLPKSSNLGADVYEKDTGDTKQEQSQFGSNFSGRKGDGSVLSGMLVDDVELGASKREVAKKKNPVNDDDFDWGAPVSSQKLVEEEEDVDWSKPFTSNGFGSGRFGIDEEEEFDWSKPVSSSRVEFSPDDSTPDFSPSNINGRSDTPVIQEEGHRAPSVLTPWGLFILTLAGQLQYNACLSILTEELHSIYIPSCCLFLLEAKDKSKNKGREEPILPLTKLKTEANLKLLQHYSENVFDHTLQNLRGMLVDWLKEEAAAVKNVSRMGMELNQIDRQKREDSVNIENVDSISSDQDVVSTSAPPSGYDLLTTLMNYTALHAATSPSLLAVNFELMHLVNTTLPWGEGSSHNAAPWAKPMLPSDRAAEASGALDPNIVPTLAISPSQLPILTSCSLPVKHLTNLATHLRLLSGCVVKALTNHTYPPISTQPLPQVRRIFDLCCAISHCLTISLNPVQALEFATSRAPPSRMSVTPSPMPAKQALTSSQGSLKRTPTPSDLQLLQDSKSGSTQAKGSYSRLKNSPSSQSPFLRRRMDSFSNQDSTIGTPNTKPSKWPGLNAWPSVLTSNEGRDSTPLSVVMVESIVSVYTGLFATAWSRHSIEDLLALLKNSPTMEDWCDVVGGGISGKKTERVVKNLFMQTFESMSKRLHLQAKETSQDEEAMPGIFIAPRKTLLDLFLSPPKEEHEEREVSRMESTGYFVVGGTEVVNPDEEDDFEEDEDDEAFGTGITFKVGGANDSKGSDIAEAAEETTPDNPNCFAWCLMNICVVKILQQTVRRMVAGVNLEVLELITVSPLLYSILKVLDEWESIFDRRLMALGEPPEDLFGSDELDDNSMFKMGKSLMRQKFIMEPENSPFRGKDRQSRNARKLWQYLVCQSDSRDTILQYLYMKKTQSASLSVDDDCSSVDTDSIASVEPICRVIHKEHDNTISAVCLNSCSRSQATVMALAVPREVLEIEVQEESYLDQSSQEFTDNTSKGYATSPKRASIAHMGRGEDFIMVQTAAQLRPKNTSMSSLFSPTQIRRSLPTLPGIPASFGSLSQLSNGSQQTGSANPVLTRRTVAGVKKMAPHPNLAYYLTGSLDGSVYMWEFGTPRHVACPRATGGAVTKIRFTPEGNKFGVTDHQGHLSLWQGIQTSSKSAYHILHSHMKYLSDFLFLGSSSLIATCGDGPDTRNLYLWDTLMPTHRSIVKEFSCHEGGATALGYCRPKQRLFCGGKKGDVCVFDIRQRALLQSISLHSSMINCIVVNDIDGYFVTGSADGDIKIVDCSTLAELESFSGLHAKSRLFRHGEAGVTDMDVFPGGKLYSCGADGTIKCQTLQFS